MMKSNHRIAGAFRTVTLRLEQAICEASYQAVGGLHALAEKLEIADHDVGEQNNQALISEHLTACLAIEVMNQSLLGRIF